MSSKKPPVPPANQSPKGTRSDPQEEQSNSQEEPEDKNFDQQGRSANTKQNTRHQGSHGSRDRDGS